jgi:arsenate reductase
MAEVGIDLSSQSSKSIDEIKGVEFDYVITLCDNAQKTCPAFPAKTGVIHVGFEDPPRLAENARDEEEAMQHYRRVRDQIKSFVDQLPDALMNKKQNVEFDPRQFLSGISTKVQNY